jgi:hypothetical protein
VRNRTTSGVVDQSLCIHAGIRAKTLDHSRAANRIWMVGADKQDTDRAKRDMTGEWEEATHKHNELTKRNSGPKT